MKQGDILVAMMPQSSVPAKVRPALYLKTMPPFQDVLVCGVSTQVHQLVRDFDELIEFGDPDFQTSGLRAASIFRLGYLAVIPHTQIKGRIGSIAPERLKRLLNNLADFLRPKP
jgi:mRNA interferase MazF